jgi:hypothetical protein
MWFYYLKPKRFSEETNPGLIIKITHQNTKSMKPIKTKKKQKTKIISQILRNV